MYNDQCCTHAISMFWWLKMYIYKVTLCSVELDNHARNVTHSTPALWVGRNSGPIFRRLLTKVHRIKYACAGDITAFLSTIRILFHSGDRTSEVIWIRVHILMFWAAEFFRGFQISDPIVTDISVSILTTDQRLTDLTLQNIRMATSPQRIRRSTSCLLGFSGSADRMTLFPIVSNSIGIQKKAVR